MNQSRRITWLVFLVGVIAVVEVLAWVSWRLVSLERQQQESREDAARQEAIGRALWRMDSIVLPLLAVESARPYWEYQSFYPAGRRADEMWLPLQEGETLVASPLLGEPVDMVRLHFERDGAGRLASPQAPVGRGREAAIAAGVPEALLARADIDLYELDRLDGNAEGGGADGLDRAVATRDQEWEDALRRSAESPTAGQPGDEPVASTETGAATSGLWRRMAEGLDAREPSGVPAASAVMGPDAQRGPLREPSPDAGALDVSPATAQSSLESVPPAPPGEVQEAGEGAERADVRQDYLARQSATENAQLYNDPSRSGRSRSLERNVYQNVSTPEAAPAPEGAALALRQEPVERAERALREMAEAATPSQREQGTAEGAGSTEQPVIATLTGTRDQSPGSAVPPGAPGDSDPPSAASSPAPQSAFASDQPAIDSMSGLLDATVDGAPGQAGASVTSPVAGPLAPQWRGSGVVGGEGALVLIRRVTVGDQSREQGVWIDWPALRRDLESSVADLFPLAQVQPAPSTPTRAGASEAQRLATLPVVLIPGPLAAGILPSAPGFWTPTRWTLLVGWIAVAAAVVAIGVVLRKAIDLGERRGRFVSAVTHELRTPLTTFRLYSQMLAGGSITDESKRQRYAQTLDRESQRLSGIVESVLEYARLGRQASGTASRQRLDLPALLDRVRPALGGRAERAGMDLAWPDAPPSGVVMGDADKIERILLNLVDNACKYAGESGDRRLVLDAAVGDGTLVLGVRDFGPGVPAGERRRIFTAFHRAKHHDASASPGLGLGLALSRGLAREMGGDLRLVEHDGPGARFELSLPTIGAPSEPPQE